MVLKILLAIFIFVFFTAKGQNEPKWKEVLLNPDLLVHFPKESEIINDEIKQTYICNSDSISLKITVEKNPLNYKGRSIADVNKEFYDNLTQNTLD